MATPKKVRVAINGFGRIGRITFRAMVENYGKNIEIVAINDLAPVKMNAHLLAHDTNYRGFSRKVDTLAEGVKVRGKMVPAITVEGVKKPIAILQERDPAKLPWRSLRVDVVLECTGFFTDSEKAAAHLKGGAKKVIISAPAKGDVQTIVLGVNDEELDVTKDIFSNASCTTNCLAPIAKAIDGLWGIDHGLMTTVHSYTNDQRMQDQVHEDPRRARAGAANIIPTTTGAAKAIGLVLPHLKGKLDGISLRVPTTTVSVVDLVVETKSDLPSLEEVKAALTAAADGKYLGVSDESPVSSDFIGDARSSILDVEFTAVMAPRTLKILSWYDNEWGYSNRLAELCALIGSKIV